MRRFLLATTILVASTIPAFEQSTPGLITGQVPTAGQWNSYFAAKQDYLGYVPFPFTGGTFQGKVSTIPPTLSGAGFNLSPGTSPNTPANGDIWTTNAGLFAQINGSTQGPYITSAAGGPSVGGNNTWTGNNTFNTGTLNVGTGIFQLGGVTVTLGTSGTTVPFLSGNNAWSGTNSYNKNISLLGSSSGTITQQTQAAAGTYNWNWPTTAGSAGQVLTSQGGSSTAMTWTTPASAASPPPQGRLTLTSATPVMTSSATGSQNVYYAPYIGNAVPIYNGSTVNPITFTSSNSDTVGLTLALAGSANWAANTVYDVFVILVSSSPTLCTGPAWSSATARAAAGSIGIFGGILTNSNASAMTCRTGAASTQSVSQNQATYLGTIATDSGTAGQVSFTYGTSASGGGASVLNIWNYYNRVNIVSSVIDSGTGYTYGTNTIRAARASNTNRITFVSGVAEEAVHTSYTENLAPSSAGNIASSGVGLDSTTAYAAINSYANDSSSTITITLSNNYTASPQIGQHFIQALENANSGTNITFDQFSNANLFIEFRM